MQKPAFDDEGCLGASRRFKFCQSFFSLIYT